MPTPPKFNPNPFSAVPDVGSSNQPPTMPVSPTQATARSSAIGTGRDTLLANLPILKKPNKDANQRLQQAVRDGADANRIRMLMIDGGNPSAPLSGSGLNRKTTPMYDLIKRINDRENPLPDGHESLRAMLSNPNANRTVGKEGRFLGGKKSPLDLAKSLQDERSVQLLKTMRTTTVEKQAGVELEPVTPDAAGPARPAELLANRESASNGLLRPNSVMYSDDPARLPSWMKGQPFADMIEAARARPSFDARAASASQTGPGEADSRSSGQFRSSSMSSQGAQRKDSATGAGTSVRKGLASQPIAEEAASSQSAGGSGTTLSALAQERGRAELLKSNETWVNSLLALPDTQPLAVLKLIEKTRQPQNLPPLGTLERKRVVFFLDEMASKAIDDPRMDKQQLAKTMLSPEERQSGERELLKGNATWVNAMLDNGKQPAVLLNLVDEMQYKQGENASPERKKTPNDYFLMDMSESLLNKPDVDPTLFSEHLQDTLSQARGERPAGDA